MSHPKQDFSQTTVSSTDLSRTHRTTYSYKMIYTDWLSGKINGECASILINAVSSGSPQQSHHSLKGQILHVEQLKYIGVDITSKLSWNPHINRIMGKGNSIDLLGFLRRNLRVKSLETKASAYFTMVRPNLE